MPAPEDPKILLERILAEGLARIAPGASAIEVQLERPRNPEHGDYSCNAAMQLARVLKRKPREIAQQLLESVQGDVAASQAFERLEVAGAGFLNARLSPVARAAVVHRVLAEGAEFGRTRPGRRARVQVEFVSANPTGPLHVGHGRGAAYGASLSSVLEFSGAEVTREFYVNDAGRQMDILALSVWLRYLQARGTVVPFPEDGYRGDYVRDIATQLTDAHVARFARDVTDTKAFPVAQPGEDPDAALDAQITAAKALLREDWSALHHFAREAMLEDQREDLAAFRVGFDNWFSETSLYETGAVEQTVRRLAERGHLYEQDGALWFRSTQFGDEKDRVVRRENGQFTYFASDIAYHADKFARGFDRVVDVWGADHHGYIPRVRGALEALGLDAERLTVALVQFAVLYRGGEKVAMGKRSGDFVTLRELREEVGNDAARFFYILRRADQHLDFDLDLAKSESQDNPVYYVQYAHARLCSVFLQWGGDAARLVDVDLAPLVSAREVALMRTLADFAEVVQSAARELAPHSIAFYARELAAHFHSYYNAERILVDDETLCAARLALCAAVRQVLANALSLLGVNAPEEM
ncbi:MAG: arginine--tRNA ligase [bacterium]